MLALFVTLEADSQCKLQQGQQQRKNPCLCCQSKLSFNQATCKPLHVVTDNMDSGGFFWIRIFFLFSGIPPVCKWGCTCFVKIVRVKGTSEEFYKPLDASNNDVTRKSRSRLWLQLNSPFVSTWSPQIFVPSSHKHFVCSMAKLWAEGPILLTKGFHCFF